MVKWSCSSSLCFNNYTTRNKNNELLKYYRLPRAPELQSLYMKIFKTDGMNWTKGHICEAHWSSGFRKDTDDLPDIAVPKDQLNKLEQKYIATYVKAKKILTSAKTQSVKQKLCYKRAKQKFETASLLSTNKPTKNMVRRKII